MGWDEVPGGVPSVSMNCPGNSVPDPVGASRTFSATISEASSVVASFIPANSELGTVTISSWSVTAGQTITFTLDTSNIGGIAASALAGTNTIQVVATNSFGSGSGSCSWTLTLPAPTVSMNCPGETVFGEPPTFVASTDYSATITINVMNEAEEVIANYSINETSASFKPDGINPGTYTVCAVATNAYGTSDTICCPWVVQPDPLEIRRDDPIAAIINETIDGSTEEKSFRAYTNRQDAEISFSVNPPATCIVDNQVTLMKGATRTIHVTVESAGMYTITATATLPNDSKSVAWRWMLQNTCSYAYEANGGVWIHICANDVTSAGYVGGVAESVLAAILGIAAATEVGAGLALILAPILITCRNDDGSIDIFIDPESYLALQAFPGGHVLNIAVIILGTKYYMTVGGE